MSLINRVYGTLRWKKSDEYCSAKLGISLEKYKELKHEILTSKNPNYFYLNPPPELGESILQFSENLDKGTAEIVGISSTEPCGPEDIIRILKIDTKKWKLSSYWNKQQRDRWLISAMVTQVKESPQDSLAEVIKNFNPLTQPLPLPIINESFINDVVGVLSVQDLHFGKEDNITVAEDFKNAVVNLVHRAYVSHCLAKIIFVFGGDILNMDTFNGATTNGTFVDNGLRAQEAYKQAFESIYWAVSYLAQFTNELHVLYLPGNHDRLSSYHLAHALSKSIKNERVIFNVEYSERKVVVCGNNFFGFEHGDVTKKNTPLVYATEFAKEWGSTTYRTCYTGHFHSKKTTEFVSENELNGFSIKHLPSLSRSDYWHYHNKFVGSKRQAVMELHDFQKGKISEFIYTA